MTTPNDRAINAPDSEQPVASNDHRKQPISAQAKALLRSLPSVARLLEHEEVGEWLREVPRATVVASLQHALTCTRDQIATGQLAETVDLDDILATAEEELVRRSMPSLRRVINATGIVLHTGLGRAPLSDAAVEAVADAAAGYCNLEFDLTTGKRGRRQAHVESLLTAVTGAPAAAVVNNNAAATLLILQTFARERQAVVSRGQLIEIGGSFRLPDIMRASGAILCEVGTTNRTRLGDYERAINDNTALLLRVHPSNFRVVGFTEEVPIEDMVELAHRHGLIAVDDLGSGSLTDLTPFGLPPEPAVRDSLTAGADLVCFSGDKLLGGPQCGIILGRRDLIDELNANPLMRTYRVDKLTLAALEATLRAYADADEARANVPTLAMLTATTEQLAKRAEQLAERLQRQLPEEHFFVGSDVAYAGGGSMPDQALPTVIVQWRPTHTGAAAMAGALRESVPPVIARIRDDAVCFDLRTVPNSEFDALVEAVSSAVWDAEHDPDGD